MSGRVRSTVGPVEELIDPVPVGQEVGMLLGGELIARSAEVDVDHFEHEAGELPKAFIALNPEATADEADLREFVAGQVASYKQLRAVEFIDEIPKSASGKILRRFLRSGA